MEKAAHFMKFEPLLYFSISGFSLPIQHLRGEIGIKELDFGSKGLKDADAIIIGALLSSNYSLMKLKYLLKFSNRALEK